MIHIIKIYSTLHSATADFLAKVWADWPIVVAVLGFLAFSWLEIERPKIRLYSRQLAGAYRQNLGLFLLNSLIMSVLSLAGLALLLQNFSGHGILRGLHDPLWKGVLSFLLLDFLLYAWHRICHRFDGFWMFHKVHHSDPYLNVTTAFRIHIVELLVITVLKGFYILLLGIDKTAVFIYEAVYPLFVMFHHANTVFPGEKWIGTLFVTPQLHRTHHAVARAQHDSNYGAIFSLWDSLLGSRQTAEPTAIGIKSAAPQSVWGLFKFGFVDNSKPAPGFWLSPSAVANIHAMIAEAAYYKAEKRAFMPGYELHDWLEAKKEILASLQSLKMVHAGKSRCRIFT